MPKDRVVWVDIPATNLERAVEFYSKVLNLEIDIQDVGESSVAVFSDYTEGVSGCIRVNNKYKPSLDGPLIYLSVPDYLDEAIVQVELCNGEVLVPKESAKCGSRAIVKDSEGNRITLFDPRAEE